MHIMENFFTIEQKRRMECIGEQGGQCLRVMYWKMMINKDGVCLPDVVIIK